MNLPISIDDSIAVRAVDGFCVAEGYKSQVTDSNGVLINNPETKLQFARRKTAQWFKSRAVAGESIVAHKTASDAATNQLIVT